MYWGEFYLILTMATVWVVRKDRACLVASVGMIMWTGLEKIIYNSGAIESQGTLYITAIFTLYVIAADYFFKRPLVFMPLAGVAMGTVLWTTADVEMDSYSFKAGKNLLYATGLLSLWLNFFTSRSESAS